MKMSAKDENTELAASQAHKPRRPSSKRAKVVPESQPEREIFARNFRRARLEAKLSQREITRMTGIAQAHISQIESAKHNMGLDTMVKLAQIVRVPLFELLKP
jgi:DNA-binding XRE family transcriptional regulator